MYMLDTLIVAVVMCVDTCNWKMKQEFEYAALQMELKWGLQRKFYEIQEKSRKDKTFYWYVKEVITYTRNKRNEKVRD